MKRILITGALGFLGSHLIEHILRTTDWEIITLDRLDCSGTLERLSDMDCWEKEKKRVNIVFHDLKAELNDFTDKRIGKINYVIHLASSTHVDRSIEDPMEFVQDNMVGTTNILLWAKKHKEIEKFVTFSTDEVFGPAPDGVYYKEDAPFNPSNPYSAAKCGQEAISKAFAFTYGMPIMITRTMNLIGERQHPEKHLPKVIRNILKGDKVCVYGTPGNLSSRCWLHCRNASAALMFLLEKGEVIKKEETNDAGQGCYHIVGEELDVLEISNEISKSIKGRELKEEEIDYIDFYAGGMRPGHDKRYAMSGDKLKAMGFKYPMTLKEGLKKIVDWSVKPEHKKWVDY